MAAALTIVDGFEDGSPGAPVKVYGDPGYDTDPNNSLWWRTHRAVEAGSITHNAPGHASDLSAQLHMPAGTPGGTSTRLGGHAGGIDGVILPTDSAGMWWRIEEFPHGDDAWGLCQLNIVFDEDIPTGRNAYTGQLTIGSSTTTMQIRQGLAGIALLEIETPPVGTWYRLGFRVDGDQAILGIYDGPTGGPVYPELATPPPDGPSIPAAAPVGMSVLIGNGGLIEEGLASPISVLVDDWYAYLDLPEPPEPPEVERPFVRLWPRDDGLGMSSAPRIRPLPKGQSRLYGGIR